MNKFKITLLRHEPPIGNSLASRRVVETEVQQDELTRKSIKLPFDDWENWYPALVQIARKNAASRFVGYESVGNDWVYLDRLEEVGAEFTPLSMTLVSDAPQQRWSVLTIYRHGHSEAVGDHVVARSHREAEFQARWRTAKNEGADPANLEGFAEHMGSIKVEECQPEPVTKDMAALHNLAAVCVGILPPAHPALRIAVEQLTLSGSPVPSTDYSVYADAGALLLEIGLQKGRKVDASGILDPMHPICIFAEHLRTSLAKADGDFAALAKAALPISDDEWGSERQIEAQNRFFEAVEARLPADKFAALEAYCHKANVHEMVEEALRLLRAERVIVGELS
jgi:hypothetical protein